MCREVPAGTIAVLPHVDLKVQMAVETALYKYVIPNKGKCNIPKSGSISKPCESCPLHCLQARVMEKALLRYGLYARLPSSLPCVACHSLPTIARLLYLGIGLTFCLIELTVLFPGAPGSSVVFGTPPSYDRVRLTLVEVGWLTEGTAANQYVATCKHSADLYSAIGCQPVRNRPYHTLF